MGLRDDMKEASVWKDYRAKARRAAIAFPVFLVVMLIGAMASEILVAEWPIYVALLIGFLAVITIIGVFGAEVFHDD
ncbi:hypothetical protein FF098_011490 [Parvularcula flava]|uniref:Uncharacterized protein n=1 Tax=Aquisalinus luteolus TaxID=1566827 RepID=A0A8J3A361_9PROT|nr:hypothetical protein [Aquisalinus luteolus]NHK28531.1 hypothetical protein [Aquisalinus luteolus]GGH98757.1 hypothetical protein GCM10011355_23100 [Aquisalinus luteolus]